MAKAISIVELAGTGLRAKAQPDGRLRGQGLACLPVLNAVLMLLVSERQGCNSSLSVNRRSRRRLSGCGGVGSGNYV
ncbi:hypothetical protein LU604_09320 [Erwinia tracheiphila]|uniref:Uncharacterized protein n=1 Tax=Erwinia tracheiphila TaxID=65700 RepID=A0A345CS81_9GAMM|nr:hypothetical protein [Erwinia tracheiphila]AXF76298.1 hypothetical protein AV903_09965 [Erwinia tracheiphila]UIA85043.1 hypothetical protein LU604_09320 [Erwinia tracheiphila]UIA93640.1 hypothetical protein LU632_09275 [Erwinia tracheiphila]